MRKKKFVEFSLEIVEIKTKILKIARAAKKKNIDGCVITKVCIVVSLPSRMVSQLSLFSHIEAHEKRDNA